MSVIDRLIGELSRLPGVGPKTALRLVHHLMKGSPDDARRLSAAIREVADKVRPCERCGSFSEHRLCAVCADPRRDASLLCVVEEAYEVSAIERTGRFRGRYHVLGGHLSPLDGIGPEELDVEGLASRLQGDEGSIEEIILATSSGVEGEATAVYLEGLLRPRGVRVTRLARGIPVGSDLEYVDGSTLAEALVGRREM
jgi:recombination protein RecR